MDTSLYSHFVLPKDEFGPSGLYDPDAFEAAPELLMSEPLPVPAPRSQLELNRERYVRTHL